jgi:hypothetical protein
MAATEKVERQVAVAVVVTVEEPPFLLAVQRIIGRIKVKKVASRSRMICLGARSWASTNKSTRRVLMATGLWLILW